MTTHVDSSNNRISVAETETSFVATLVDDPQRGYVGERLPGGGFGDEDCPCSYGRPCAAWFGPGERFATAAEALAALDPA